MARQRTLVVACACALGLAVSAAPLCADLVSYWTFDNPADVGQATIGLNLTANGDAQYTAAGQTGGGLLLDGAGDYLGGTPFVATADSPYTTSAWIKPDVTGDRGIVGWGNYGSGRQVNALRENGDNDLLNYWWGADLNRNANTAGVDLDDGGWHHVATVYDGTVRRLYVDGKPVGSDTPGDNNASSANFRIGSTNNAEYFDGTIDSVALYNNALSPNQIAALAGGTAPAALPAADRLVANWVADDYTGGNWIDRVSGLAAQVEGAPGTGTLGTQNTVAFGGSDAFRVAAADSPMGLAADFTLAVVFETSTAGVGDETSGWWNNSGIVDMEMPGWVQDWGLVINSASSIGAGLGGANPNQITLPSAQTGLNDGQGHVAVYARKGNTVYLTVDGVTVSQTNSHSSIGLERLINDFTIARRQTGGNFYTGELGEILIYDGAMTNARAHLAGVVLGRAYGMTNTTAWNVAGPANWDQAGNWTAGVPGLMTDATIDNGGTAQINTGMTAQTGTLQIGGTTGGTLDWLDGTLGAAAISVGNGGVLNRTAAAWWAYNGQMSLTGNGQVIVGGNAEFQLDDGGFVHLNDTSTLNAPRAIILGNAGDTDLENTIVVDDNATLMTGWLVVGKNGRRGRITQTGGTVTANNNLWIAEYIPDGTSEGLYEMSGGVLNVPNGAMYVGKDNGTSGRLEVRGTAQINVNSVLRVGNDGYGILNQTGGTINSNDWVTVAEGGTGVGFYNLGGTGVLNVNTNGGDQHLVVGVNGNGTMTIADSAQVHVQNASDFYVARGGASTGVVTQSGTSTVTADLLILGENAGAAGVYNLQGGTLNVRDIIAGISGSGTFTQTAGTSTVTGWMYAGENAGSQGVINVTGGTLTVNGTNIYVGGVDESWGQSNNGAQAELNVGGSAIVTGNILKVANKDAAATGAVTVSGNGTINVSGFWLGNDGRGTTVLSGNGFLNASNYASIGTDNGGVGILTMQDNAQFFADDLNISDRAGSAGEMYVHGGTATTNNLFVGKGANTTALLQQTAGTVSVLTGGDTARIADDASSQGTYNLSGGTFQTIGHMHVGWNGTGTLNASGTAQVNVGGWFVSGRQTGSTGTIGLSGNAQATAGNGVIVAELGAGNLNVADSATLNTELVRVGFRSGSTGTATQTGGTVTTGVVNIASLAGSTGTYNLGGGLLETPAVMPGAGTAAIQFNGGTLHTNVIGLNLANNGGTLDVSPIPGRLVRVWYDGNDPTDTNPPENWNALANPPWDVDSDTNSTWGGGDQPPLGFPGGSQDYYSVVYAGQVYVPATGTVAFREQVDDSTVLFVDGTRLLWDYTAGSDMGEPAGDPWTVHSTTTTALSEGWHDIEIRFGDHYGGQGGVLQWDPTGGTNWQELTAADIQTPDQAVILGDYTQSDAGTLALQIPGLDSYSQLLVMGQADLAGILTAVAGPDVEVGDVFTILQADDLTGRFGLVEGSGFPFPDGYWRTSYDYDAGTVTLEAAVPEPATMACLLAASAALGGYLRRRRRA